MTARPDTQGTAALVSSIREAILMGELNPGQRLVESELSQRFDAPRGSVREALVLLENEGLTMREANRGAWVRPIPIEEAIEITELRGVVEGLCAARAATSATAKDREELQQLGADMQEATKRGDVMTYSRLSQDLHLKIRDISGQRTASDVLNRLRYQSVRYQFSIALLPGRPAAGTKEHLAVIKAVVSGRPDYAEKTMRGHLLSVIDAIKQLPDTVQTPHAGLRRS